MKKAFICIALMACVSSAHAQPLKFMLGPTFSNYTGRWPSSIFMDSLGQSAGLNPFKNTKVGTVEGIGLEAKLYEALRLEVEVLYGDMGSKFSAPAGLLAARREDYTMTGLSIPVLFKIRPPLKHAVPYAVAGFELVAILGHTRTSLIRPEDSLIYEEVAREDLGKATKTFGFGPLVGIGIEIPVLGQAFFLEGRYRVGLENLVTGYPSDLYNAKLRSFMFLIGYQMK